MKSIRFFLFAALMGLFLLLCACSASSAGSSQQPGTDPAASGGTETDADPAPEKNDETAPQTDGVPEYDPHDYLAIQRFLCIQDEKGVANGRKYNPSFDANDPDTWKTDPTAFWVGWEVQEDGRLHLTELVLSFYQSFDHQVTGELELSDCLFLKKAYLSYGLTGLRLDGCIALEEVSCHYCALGCLELRNCPALTVFCANDCKVSTFRTVNCPRLESLQISNMSGADPEGQLQALDLSGSPNLTTLCLLCAGVKTLDLSGLSCLSYMDIRCNGLTEVDLSPCPVLNSLHIDGNPLETLDLSGCPALTVLMCDHCALTELDLSPCPGLKTLYCSGNPLSSLDLSHSSELGSLNLTQTKITELDLSSCPKLYALQLKDNPLQRINLTGCREVGFNLLRAEGKGSVFLTFSKAERTITVTAAHGNGARFKGWYDAGGTLVSDREEYTFLIFAHEELIAVFENIS